MTAGVYLLERRFPSFPGCDAGWHRRDPACPLSLSLSHGGTAAIRPAFPGSRELWEAGGVPAGLAVWIQGFRSRKPSVLSYKSFSAMYSGN